MAWEKTDEEIIAYLSGDLTPEETKIFEQKLESDSALQQAMDRHQTFENQLINYGEFKQTENRVQSLNKQFSQQQAQKQKKHSYLLTGVVSIVLLLTLIFIFQMNQQYCPQDLYAGAFTTRTAPEIAGQAQTAEQELRMAHSLFNQSQINKAAILYQQVLETDLLTDDLQMEAHFFLGQCQLLLDKFEASIPEFSQITTGPYQPLSQWYTALAYLAIGQAENAKPILDIISQQAAHDRQEAAIDLLKKWKRLKDCP